MLNEDPLPEGSVRLAAMRQATGEAFGSPSTQHVQGWYVANWAEVEELYEVNTDQDALDAAIDRFLADNEVDL